MNLFSLATPTPERVLAFVCQDPAPQAFGSPDARAKTFKLDNLAVVDKEIDLRAIVFDIPGKDFGLCCFEHDLLQAQCTNDLCHGIGTPCFHILGDAFRLDHNHVCSSLQEAPGLADGPFHVTRAFSLELPGGTGSAGAKLDSDLGLGFESSPLYFLYQAQP